MFRELKEWPRTAGQKVFQTSSDVGPVIKGTGRHLPGCCRALQGFDQDARQRTSRFASGGHWMSATLLCHILVAVAVFGILHTPCVLL